MNYEFALVFFTVFSQLAIGMSIFVFWRMGSLAENRKRLSRIWMCICAIGVFALISSFCHLGHPFAAYHALYNLGDSWLSIEGLLFVIFCGLSFIAIFRPARWLAGLTALCGVCVLVAQGLTYAQPSMPALYNAFPLVLFCVAALACGACSENMLIPDRSTKIARPAILTLLIMLLMAPVFWTSGAPVMAQTAVLWAGSGLFWIGIACLIWAFIASFLKNSHHTWQLASLLFGLFLTRMVFFADTVHTASRIGQPFN